MAGPASTAPQVHAAITPGTVETTKPAKLIRLSISPRTASFPLPDSSDDDRLPQGLPPEDHFDEDVSSQLPSSEDAAISRRNLPEPAVGRLSLYYRELFRLRDSGTTSINSRELGKLVNVSPAVVRRDLSALGTIGRRGVGYTIDLLIEAIGRLLGSGVQWQVILVGVGSLGDALLRYRGFERLGFRLVAAFDVDPRRIGTSIGGVRVRDANDLKQALVEFTPDLAILAVPAEKAADVASDLVSGGITGILNFAPTTLRLSSAIAVVNVDLASELQRLAFSVQKKK